MNENKDLIHYLYSKKSIKHVENVIYARDAFQVRRVSEELIKEFPDRYESLKDFLEQTDPIEEMENIRQNSITQRIDKSQNPAYTNPVVVQAPTSIPVVPPRVTYVPVPVLQKNVDDMLDRWMTKE